jgi:hypothetical protein
MRNPLICLVLVFTVACGSNPSHPVPAAPNDGGTSDAEQTPMKTATARAAAPAVPTVPAKTSATPVATHPETDASPEAGLEPVEAGPAPTHPIPDASPDAGDSAPMNKSTDSGSVAVVVTSDVNPAPSMAPSMAPSASASAGPCDPPDLVHSQPPSARCGGGYENTCPHDKAGNETALCAWSVTQRQVTGSPWMPFCSYGPLQAPSVDALAKPMCAESAHCAYVAAILPLDQSCCDTANGFFLGGAGGCL